MSCSQAKIVPHGNPKAKGIDICAKNNIYIIRSDLKCYMKTALPNLDHAPNFRDQSYTIFPLHPICTGADHYVGGPNGFNIIKDDYFITVSDLSMPIDLPIKKIPLSEYCKGGDNYLYDGQQFIIIRGDKYTYADQLTSTNGTSGTLNSSINGGLYYFGAPFDDTAGGMFVILQNDVGVMFATMKKPDTSAFEYAVYPNVIDFLPGGISVGFGVSTPKWVMIKSVTNSSESSKLEWSESIEKTTGYNKSHFQSLENNWSIDSKLSMGTSFQVGFLVQASIEAQFSLSTSFGGASVQTAQEDWNEAYKTTENISVTIEPNKSIYIWQFRMGLGVSDDVLFCRDLRMTDTPEPPTSLPTHNIATMLAIQ